MITVFRIETGEMLLRAQAPFRAAPDAVPPRGQPHPCGPRPALQTLAGTRPAAPRMPPDLALIDSTRFLERFG
jgi:hypothetical protein